MTSETLTEVYHLTDENNHNEARILIAKQFEFCADLLKVFEAIKLIHRFEGHMPVKLVDYRGQKTKQMLERISKAHGEDMKHKIIKAL